LSNKLCATDWGTNQLRVLGYQTTSGVPKKYQTDLQKGKSLQKDEIGAANNEVISQNLENVVKMWHYPIHPVKSRCTKHQKKC